MGQVVWGQEVQQQEIDQCFKAQPESITIIVFFFPHNVLLNWRLQVIKKSC